MLAQVSWLQTSWGLLLHSRHVRSQAHRLGDSAAGRQAAAMAGEAAEWVGSLFSEGEVEVQRV